MDYKVVEKNNKKYIIYEGNGKKLSSEEDILNIISNSMESNTGLVVINSKVLAEDFFNLRTGLAGMALQKFINYHIKFVIILDDKKELDLRFKEMILEANKGNEFRVFSDINDGEKWLLNIREY